MKTTGQIIAAIEVAMLAGEGRPIVQLEAGLMREYIVAIEANPNEIDKYKCEDVAKLLYEAAGWLEANGYPFLSAKVADAALMAGDLPYCEEYRLVG